MHKTFLTALAAATMLTVTAGPSVAAVYTGQPPTYNNILGVYPNATNTEVFGNDLLQGAADTTFTDTFVFTTTVAGLLNITTATSSGTSELNDIDNFRLNLSGPGVNSSVTDLDPGFNSFLSLSNVLLGVGNYILTIQGTLGGANTSYSGTVTFSPSPVPLPGAFLLMGTVLAGGAGLRKWRSTRKNSAVPA